MKLSDLTIPPELERIWHYQDGSWLVYAPGYRGDKFYRLDELLPGQTYSMEANGYCELGDLDLDQPGRFQSVVWRDQIQFQPGEQLTQAWWDYARHTLKSISYTPDPWVVAEAKSYNRPVPTRRTMYDVLHDRRVLRVVVVKPGDTPPPDAPDFYSGIFQPGTYPFATVYPPTRTIYVRDEVTLPVSEFPTALVHESVHFQQFDLGWTYLRSRDELMAMSAANAALHTLLGDLDVWRDQSNPLVKELLAVSWP